MEEEANRLTSIYEKYLPYFSELRKQIFISAIIFVAALIIGIIYSQKILTVIIHLYNFKAINLVLTSPYQFINLSFFTGFLLAVLLTSPYLLFSLFRFAKPALRQSEIKLIKAIFPLSILLFVVGFVLGAWVMQFIINFYSGISLEVNVNSLWDIQHFFSQILLTSFFTGLIFETPLIVTMLIRLRIIKRSALVSKRRYVYASLLFFAVIFPPTTDAVSLILTTLPLLFLFELGLLLNRHQM